MDKPLLILAFNRPQHIKRLIDSLRPYEPKKILISVDGPRPNNKNDAEKVSKVLEEIQKIAWTSDIELRIREKNLGLRFAVADAVTWAIDKYGETIVVEDDVEVGPEFLDFMSEMLDQFRGDTRIGHISGYNLVPEASLANPNDKFRLSRIPESYAWATWKRAWDYYNPDLSQIKRQKFKFFASISQSNFGGMVWKINFLDASRELINSWAYRWVASLWSQGLLCVSPNRNLVRYTGHENGTHTILPSKNKELPIASVLNLSEPLDLHLDSTADTWIQIKIFGASFTGVLVRLCQSIALSVLKKFPLLRKFLLRLG